MAYIMSNYLELPLTTRSKGTERVPSVSGLNWGQRLGRNENQAYLSVPVDVQRSEFFPPPGEQFMLHWDDGEQFVCVRAQQNGKAIQTPYDNSILGKYFRRRLGVGEGDSIVMAHLVLYGRASVEIFKDSGNQFYADFSSSK